MSLIAPALYTEQNISPLICDATLVICQDSYMCGLLLALYVTGWEVQKQCWDGVRSAGYLLGIGTCGRRRRKWDEADGKSTCDTGPGKTQPTLQGAPDIQSPKNSPMAENSGFYILHDQSLDVGHCGKTGLRWGKCWSNWPWKMSAHSIRSSRRSPFWKKADCMGHLGLHHVIPFHLHIILSL